MTEDETGEQIGEDEDKEGGDDDRPGNGKFLFHRNFFR
jgi:hypothetical protein